MLTGVSLIASTYFFFIGLSKGDAPVAVALFQLVPVFTLLWGCLFFNESFTAIKYIGIACVIVGASLISYVPDKATTKLYQRISAALPYMLVSTVITSLSYALQKYLLLKTTFLTIYFWARIGDIVTVLLLMILIRKWLIEFVSNVKLMFGKLLYLNVFNELINSSALLLLILAYSSGPLSLVSTLAATQPLFVLMFVMLANSLFKNLVTDSSTGRVVIRRLILITIIILGVFLISC